MTKVALTMLAVALLAGCHRYSATQLGVMCPEHRRLIELYDDMRNYRPLEKYEEQMYNESTEFVETYCK